MLDHMNYGLDDAALVDFVVGQLQAAIARSEVQLTYQDVYELQSRRPSYREAFFSPRLVHCGMQIRTDATIQIAERHNLIDALGRLILEQACRDCREWADMCAVAVNVSALQLARGNFDEVVRDILRETGLPPDRLEIEITESAVLGTSSDTIMQLTNLVEDGVGLALDDFGVGYSCLQSLWRFPFTSLKIDASFIRAAEKCERCYQIIRTMGELARRLQIGLVAEGIESESHLSIARKAGCRLLQGYLFSKPREQMQVLVDINQESRTASAADGRTVVDWGAFVLPIQFVEEINECAKSDDLIDIVARWASVVLSADRASISLKLDDNALTSVAFEGNAAIPQGHRMPLEGSMSGRVFRTREPELCDDLASSQDLGCKILAQAGMNSAVVVPLVSGEYCFGTLNVASKNKAYREDDLRRLQSLGRWLAAQMHIRKKLCELSSAANVDPQTGLLTRAGFLELLDKKEHSENVCVVLVDVSSIVSANALRNSSQTDFILISVAEVLVESTRRTDAVSRISNLQFAVLLRDSDKDRSDGFVRRLRRKLARSEISSQSRSRLGAAQFGIAVKSVQNCSGEELLQAAARALSGERRTRKGGAR